MTGSPFSAMLLLMVPFSEFILHGLAWLDQHAAGAACFVGPDDRQYTAVPFRRDDRSIVHFNLIDPSRYELQYIADQEALKV